ncbi:MAG: hypothetical protein KJ732_07960 [Candidatus Margulisbacteria bacterium]|nr:hypothetical protein [Candidatus Margulisiibacteriota bacterium]
MKRIVAMFTVVVLVIGLTQAAFAQLAEKKEELAKVKKYIILLDEKIRKARGEKKINKIAEINEAKRQQLARAKLLGEEIVKLEKAEGGTSVASKPGPKIDRSAGFQVNGGLAGGSLALGAGYLLPVAQNIDLAFEAGYAIGNSFSIVIADVAAIMPLGNNFAGLEAGLANYSKTVSGVPGVSGNIGGSNFGAGIFGGTTFGKIKVKIGYNTALGLTAAGVYKF